MKKWRKHRWLTETHKTNKYLKKNGAEYLFKELIAENFPNLGNKSDIQVHKANGWSY